LDPVTTNEYDPAVATNGNRAILTSSSGGDVFYSTSLLQDRSNWLGDMLPSIKGKSLSDIVFPGSHDAGMYRSDNLGKLALTQDQSLYEQLQGGSRYFDLRVEAGSPQRIYHGPDAKSFFQGPPVYEVLNDIKRFMAEGHKEAVVLKFSHFRGFDGCATNQDYKTLRDEISSYLSEWIYAGSTHPLTDPLDTMLQNGGKVIVLVSNHYAEEDCKAAKEGFFIYRNWDTEDFDGQAYVFDEYSSTTDLNFMKTDQLKKLANYTGLLKNKPSISSDLFLLSWTLTPTTDVSSVSLPANRDLGLDMNSVGRNAKGFIPNVLFVDYYQRARVTDVAVTMNQRLVQ
jgi:hypothetical protein